MLSSELLLELLLRQRMCVKECAILFRMGRTSRVSPWVVHTTDGKMTGAPWVCRASSALFNVADLSASKEVVT